jgi:polygalacturonase
MRWQIAPEAPELLRIMTWLAILLAGTLPPPMAEAQSATEQSAGRVRVFDVRAYGAKGDGRTIDTQSIQQAIRAAHTAGGRRMVFLPGTYGNSLEK